MNKTKSIEVDVGGKKIRFESGLLAKQANGAVTVQLGETIVFSAVTASDKPKEGIDYFPLQVEYREKFYAAGRFPGGYFKRESRPSEKEILTARVTDRPIRPLFPDGYYNEVQINNSLLSADGENESDVLCINAASAALTLSDIPFMGPIAAVRVGRIDGQFVVNPTHTEIASSDLNLIYVGTRDLPLMIEGHASEISEADMVAAMKVGHQAIRPADRRPARTPQAVRPGRQGRSRQADRSPPARQGPRTRRRRPRSGADDRRQARAPGQGREDPQPF